MKMSKTTLKELTKKYRAVLIKCAMLNAIACGVLYSGSVLADSPVDIKITPDCKSNCVNPGTYSTVTNAGVYVVSGNVDLGDNVNSIKTTGPVPQQVVGIEIKEDGFVSANSLSGGMLIEAKESMWIGNAFGISSTGSSNINGVGDLQINSEKAAKGIATNSTKTNTISFANSKTISAVGPGEAYGIHNMGSGTTTVNNIAKVSAKSDAAYGVANTGSGTLKVNFASGGGIEVQKNSASSNIYGVYAIGTGETIINNLFGITAKMEDAGVPYGIYSKGSSDAFNLKVSFSSSEPSVIIAENMFGEGGYSAYVIGKGTTTIDVGGSKLTGNIYQGGTTTLHVLGNIDLTKAELKSGTFSLVDDTIREAKIGTLSLVSTNLILDVNLESQEIDTLSLSNAVDAGTLNIAGFNLIGNAVKETTTIDFADSNLMDYVSVANSYTLGGITYSVTYDKTTGKLTFAQQTSSSGLSKKTVQSGGSSSDISAASAIDQAMKDGKFDKEIYQKLVSQGGNAVKDIKPTEAQAVTETVMNVSTMVNNMVSGRLEARSLGNTSLSTINGRLVGQSGGEDGEEKAVWGRLMYNHSKQSSSSNNPGFKSDTVGFTIGTDAEVSDDLIVGVGYAYDKTDIDSGNKDTDVKSHTFFVYAHHDIDDKMFVRGNAGYNFATYREKVSYLGHMGKYNVKSYLANMDLGYNLGNGFTPMAGLRFAHMDKDTYTDEAGQKIRTKDVTVLRGVVGVDYAKEVETDGFKWTPKAGLGVSYDIKNTKSVAVVNVGSAGYRVEGERLKREALEARLGASTSYNNWDFSVDYELNLREKFQSHTGMVKAVYKF